MRRVWIISLIALSLFFSCQKDKEEPKFAYLTWGFSLHGFPLLETQLVELVKETKISPQIVQFYIHWPKQLDHFELDPFISTLQSIANFGALPCISWEPMILSDKEKEAVSSEQILKGQYDAYLEALAEAVKKWSGPIIIRFASEMNLIGLHWGTAQSDYGKDSPEIYIKIFRYVVDFFKKEQVKNVLWGFCPNSDADPNEPWNQVKYYYPGDEYVDILGMDGYNWGVSEEEESSKKSVSFEQIFDRLYHELKAISFEKPIVVFETATLPMEGNKKTLWIKEALQTAKKWNIAAILWFQVKKEEDWRLQVNENEAHVPLIRSAVSPFYKWIYK